MNTEYKDASNELPELDTDVLVLTTEGKFAVAWLEYNRGEYTWFTTSDISDRCYVLDVSYWWELPHNPNSNNMEEEKEIKDEVVTIEFLKSKGWDRTNRGNGFIEMKRQIDYIGLNGRCERRKQRVTFYEVAGVKRMSIRISYNDFVLEDKVKNLTTKRLISHLRHAGLEKLAVELES